MQNKTLNTTVYFIFLYVLWGPLITKSIYAKPLYVYFVILTMAILFVFSLLKTYRYSISYKLERIFWIPYLILMLFSQFLSGSMERTIYWGGCVVFLFMASCKEYILTIPRKFLIFTGVFSTLGIGIQLFAPSFYSENIEILYPNDSIYKWLERNYGCAGFSYQLGQTAIQLIYAIGAYIYLLSIKLNSKIKWDYIVLLIFYLGLLFVGKRTLAAVGIIVPLAIYYLSSTAEKMLSRMFVILILLGSLYFLFMNNLDYLSSIPGFGHYVSSIEDYNQGEDITTNRSNLSSVALAMFAQNPLFGIGVDMFTQISGEDMDIHNAYLQVLCEQGLFGFSLFIIPLIYCLFSTIKLLRSGISSLNIGYLKFSLYIQLVFILYSFTGNSTSNLYGFMVYFYAIGILLCYRNYYRFN